MASIAEIRAQYPQYQDMSDEQLADAMHRKFYSDMPREEFNARIGLAPQSEAFTRGLSELSAITQNPARAQYDALPAWQKPLVAASDVVSLAADGATFGFGDKAVAGARSLFTGKSYEDELAEQRRLTAGAANRAGGAGMAAQITGAVAAPLAAAGKGATLAGRFGTGGMTGAKGLGARTGLMAAEGAGYGALTAAGHDQDVGTGALVGAAGGAGGNLLGEGLAAGVGKVAGAFNKKAPRATVSDLKASANEAYKRAEDAGVIYNNTGVNWLLNGIKKDLAEHGFHPKNETGAVAALNTLQRLAKGGNLTLKGLDTVRKMASNGYIPGNASNNAVIGKIIARIDELVEADLPPALLTAKDPKAAASAMKEARGLWGRARKLETVEELVEKGGRIGRTNKSQNVEQTTKRQLRRILDNKAVGRGFTKAEKEAANKAIGYTPGQSALDVLSGMMPSGKLSGMVQGSIGAANMATGNLLGLGLQGAGMATGFAARKASEALAKKSVEEFVDLVARGGVPAPVVQNALQRLTASKRDAITRALMAISVNRTAEAPAYQ